MHDAPSEPAGTPRARLGPRLACLLVALGLVGLDLFSKVEVMGWLEARDPHFVDTFEADAEPMLVRDAHGHYRHPLVGNWFGVMHELNYGAAFGQLDSIPYLLVIGRCLAGILLVVLVLRAPPGGRVYLTSLVLILAGAVGNLWDNLFYEPQYPREGMPFGPVRDWIDLYFEGFDYHFPTFNLADSYITVGAVLMILSGFFRRPEPEAAPDATDETPEGEGTPGGLAGADGTAVRPAHPTGDVSVGAPGEAPDAPGTSAERSPEA